MTTPQGFASLSVRGEAQRTTAPDEARMFATVEVTAGSKVDAVAEVQSALVSVLAELAALGGSLLTTESVRAALTWSTQSMQTHEEHSHNKVTGEHGPTGRHQVSVVVVVTVRDFSLLPGVAATITGRDAIDVHSVTWSVDDDNAEWALVRADAIRAALTKGRDYAAALGGAVVSVDHVADAGLLGGDNNGGRNFAMAASSGGGGQLSVDPVPQILNATIEARFTATVSPLPAG